jgi:hypothetical protein
MLKVEKSTMYHMSGKKSYHLVVYQIPWRRYLWGRVYHWYDMRIPTKIPGWGWFQRLLVHRFGAEILMGFEDEPEPRWRDRIHSWIYNQDMRCHHLNYASRESFGRVEIDEETYRRL